jgi:hypothetical protein
MDAHTPDPLTDCVRTYLREHFGEVKDESPLGDYFVFSVKVDGMPRELKVHRDLFVFADVIPEYLNSTDIARQLKTIGNVEIADPGILRKPNR